MLQRLDFWLTLFTLGAGLYFLGWKDFLEPRIRPLLAWLGAQWGQLPMAARTAPFTPNEPPLLHQDAPEPHAEPVRSVRDPGVVAVLNAEDAAMVARMILHNRSAIKPTKTETVYAGCGKRRGESPTYVRCAELYELFFNPPVAVQFPALAAQRTKQQVK